MNLRRWKLTLGPVPKLCLGRLSKLPDNHFSCVDIAMQMQEPVSVELRPIGTRKND